MDEFMVVLAVVEAEIQEPHGVVLLPERSGDHAATPVVRSQAVAQLAAPGWKPHQYLDADTRDRLVRWCAHYPV